MFYLYIGEMEMYISIKLYYSVEYWWKIAEVFPIQGTPALAFRESIYFCTIFHQFSILITINDFAYVPIFMPGCADPYLMVK